MWGASVAAMLATAALTGPGFAQGAVKGQPTDGATGLQPGVTDVARNIHQFDDLLLVIISAVSALVLGLLIWVMVRYNAGANPTPKKFTHNVTVEVIWTVVPVIILVVISAFSFPILFEQERIPKQVDLTIKATGNTWNWTYDYPDHGVNLTANMLDEAGAAAANKPYRLGTDEPIYVPVGATVRMLVTANDVIHAWTVPAFGIKEDAVPGRVNEGWFRVNEPGVYYGQCSELCGIKHAFMPIEVHAVSKPEFEAWIKEKGGAVAEAPGAPTDAADAASAPTAG